MKYKELAVARTKNSLSTAPLSFVMAATGAGGGKKDYLKTLAKDVRENVDRFVEYPTTLKAPFNLNEMFPKLKPKVAVLLHPRRATKPLPLTASKIGGHIYWPRDEPWPYCVDHPDNPLVPVLQLNKKDAPLLGFPPGKNLFQMLWCPTDDHYDPDQETRAVPKSQFFWRSVDERKHEDILLPEEVPEPEDDDDWKREWIPEECALYPETVTEYPDCAFEEFRIEMIPHFEAWHKEKSLSYDVKNAEQPSLYFRDLLDSVIKETLKLEGWSDEKAEKFKSYQENWRYSSGTKLGGYECWYVSCQKCGKPLEHFLSISTSEYGYGDTRWLPINEENAEPESHGMDFDGVTKFTICACRACEGMPRKAISF